MPEQPESAPKDGMAAAGSDRLGGSTYEASRETIIAAESPAARFPDWSLPVPKRVETGARQVTVQLSRRSPPGSPR
jgi:hypothetical protein